MSFVRDFCTMCGEFRGEAIREIRWHFSSDEHQAAVRRWDEKHAGRLVLARVRTHHDGHVALKIACGCGSR